MRDEHPDRYLVPAAEGHGEFRDRGSKFVARLAHVRDEAAALEVVQQQAVLHSKCNHHCYAYRLGEGQDRYRANDDGEPSGTAGKPILGQIDKANLSDAIVVVSRYYGGTKLGTSGLIQAYREAARQAVEAAPTRYQALVAQIQLAFGYEMMTPVLSALSQMDLEMAGQDFGASATVTLELPRSQAPTILRRLKAKVAGVYEEEVGDDFEVPGLRVVEGLGD